MEIKNILSIYRNRIMSSSIASRVFGALKFSFIGAGFSKVCVLVASILFSRILGKEAYGQYSLVNSTINTFVTFASMGIGASVFRYTSHYRKRDNVLCGHYIGSLSTICIFMSAIASIIMFAFSKQISAWVSKEADISFYLRIAAVIILLISVGTVYQNVLLGFEKFKMIAINDIVYGCIELFAGSILTLFWGLLGAVFSLLVARLFFAILMLVSTYKTVNDEKIAITYNIDRTTLNAFRSMALPSFLAGLLVMPVTWFLNMQLIKAAGYGEMAVYSVGAQWAAIITYITSQFTKVKPIYTSLIADGKYAEFRKLLKKMILVSSLVGGAGALVGIIFSESIMSFYGVAYTEYTNVFRVMMIAVLFISVQSQFGSVFEATGHMWFGFMLNLLWAIVIMLVFVLLKSRGAMGYSIAYLASYMIHAGISWVVIMRLIGREMHIKPSNVNENHGCLKEQ